MYKIPVIVAVTAVYLSIKYIVILSAVPFVMTPYVFESNLQTLRLNAIYLFIVPFWYALFHAMLKLKYAGMRIQNGMVALHALIRMPFALAIMGPFMILISSDSDIEAEVRWLWIHYAIIAGVNLLVFLYYWLYTYIRNRAYAR